MQLCVQEVEKREALEEELEDAKKILKKTLCEDCKSNLKSGQPTKKKSGITIKGNGNKFIMSLLAVSVALVAVYAPGTQNQAMVGPVPNNIVVPEWEAPVGRRNLGAYENLDTAVQLYEEKPKFI